MLVPVCAALLAVNGTAIPQYTSVSTGGETVLGLLRLIPRVTGVEVDSC